MSDSWAVLQTSSPAGWIYQASNVSLPFQFTGSIGLEIKFNVTIPALYCVTISFNVSQCSYQSNVSFALDGILKKTEPIASISCNDFAYTFNWTESQVQNIFIWGDNSMVVEQISINPIMKTRNINISLTSFPGLEKVAIVTNILLEDIIDFAEL